MAVARKRIIAFVRCSPIARSRTHVPDRRLFDLPLLSLCQQMAIAYGMFEITVRKFDRVCNMRFDLDSLVTA